MCHLTNEPIRATALYNQELSRHFRQPANVGTLATSRKDVGYGAAGRQRDGCVIRFYLQIGSSGRVAKSRYRVFGCPLVIAACSLLSDSIVNWPAGAVARIDVQPLVAVLDPPAAKRGVLLIIEDALRAAVRDYGEKQKA